MALARLLLESTPGEQCSETLLRSFPTLQTLQTLPPPRPFASVRFDPLAWSSGSDQRRISGCGIRWLLAGPDSLPLWLCRVMVYVLLCCWGVFPVLTLYSPRSIVWGLFFFSSLSSCQAVFFFNSTCISLLIILCMIVYVTNNKEPWTLRRNTRFHQECLRSSHSHLNWRSPMKHCRRNTRFHQEHLRSSRSHLNWRSPMKHCRTNTRFHQERLRSPRSHLNWRSPMTHCRSSSLLLSMEAVAFFSSRPHPYLPCFAPLSRWETLSALLSKLKRLWIWSTGLLMQLTLSETWVSGNLTAPTECSQRAIRWTRGRGGESCVLRLFPWRTLKISTYSEPW